MSKGCNSFKIILNPKRAEGEHLVHPTLDGERRGPKRQRVQWEAPLNRVFNR